MKTRWPLALAGSALLAALLFAQGANLALIINGKAVPGKTVVVKGQTYVPVSALKAAGASVALSSGKLTITFPTSVAGAGGANQVAALEGGLNDWLFNGIWRFRATSVAPLEGERPGWKVGVELRNGTKLDNLALSGSGFESLTLVMADGNALKPYNIVDITDRPMGQGAQAVLEMTFYDDEGNGRKPEKLLLRIAPDTFTRDYLKRLGAAYSVPDPSFRVKLGG